MWTHIIIAIVGFAAGVSYKELLSRNRVNSNREPSHNRQRPIFNETKERSNQQQTPASGFSLDSLNRMFSSYGIKLVSSNSFSMLLKQIRNKCYKDMLEHFLNNATSAETLVKMLQQGSTPTLDIVIQPSTLPPFITEDKLDSIIRDNSVDPSQIGTARNKVEFLLTLYHTFGIEEFKKALGVYMTDIIDAHEKGADTSFLYGEIMKIIKNRYDFL